MKLVTRFILIVCIGFLYCIMFVVAIAATAIFFKLVGEIFQGKL